MDKEIFLNEFGHLAQGPDGVKKLRDLILQLAVQGKLVEQDPNDEPASVLFEKVKQDCATALKAKVIKKSRLFSVESSPFAGCVPDSWLVLTISQIANVFNGNSVSASDKKSKYSNVSEGYSYIATKDVDFKSHEIDYENGIKIPFGTPKFKIAPEGAVLICAEGGSAGKKLAITNQDICFGNKLYASVPFTTVIDSKFLFYIYKTPQFISQFQEAMTGLIGGISQTSFLALSVPLPSPSEQKRIVTKVDELMALCDELEATQETNVTIKRDCVASTLHHLSEATDKDEIKSNWSIAENNFGQWFDDLETVKNLRATILQLAVQGDFTSKSKRNVEGRFPIPSDWKWGCLSDLLIFGPRNGYSPKAVDYETRVKTLTLTAVTSGRFSEDNYKYIDEEIPDDSHLWLETNDILIQRSNSIDHVGVSAVYTASKGDFIYPDLMMRLTISPEYSTTFIHTVLSSPSIRAYFRENASGTSGSMPKINQNTVNNTPIPLPSLEEQKRIVVKVDELMALCDELETQILSSQNLNQSLMASLCHHMTVN